LQYLLYSNFISQLLQIKSNLHYTRLIAFRVSRVSGAHPCGFAPGPTHQGCSGGESLAMCERFDRLGIWTPYLLHQKRTSYHLFYLVGPAITSN